MATNSFFTHNTSVTDRALVDAMVVESIQIAGLDIKYLPRTNSNVDALFDEAEKSSFSTAYTVEVVVHEDNQTGLSGDGDQITRWGYEARDAIKLTVSKTRFEAVVTAGDATITQPREGDLIYFSLGDLKQLYEITFVEDQMPFYQLGSRYTYEIDCSLFKFSDESFNTGVADIDAVETIRSYSIDLVLASGSGNYTVGETVYQGANLGAATAQGEVATWTTGTNTLRVINISGQFVASSNVIGNSSSTTRSLTTADTQELPSDMLAQNKEIETAADGGIINFTETNPFGEF